jgi:peptidoglycan-N-acetylglucosamine deacetylase
MNEQHPVFYDSTKRRQAVASFLLSFFAVIAIVVLCGVIISIVETPTLDDSFATAHGRHLKSASSLRRLLEWTDPQFNRPARLHGLADVRNRARFSYVLRRDRGLEEAKRRLAAVMRSEDENLRKHETAGVPAVGTAPITLAFYVEDPDSLDSLQQHSQQITHFAPAWLTLSADGKSVIDDKDDPAPVQGQPLTLTDDQSAEEVARRNGMAILPVLQNCFNGTFEDIPLEKLINTPANRDHVIASLLQLIKSHQYQGINVDLETFNVDDKPLISAFMRQLSMTFHANHLLVTQDILVSSYAYDLQTLAHYNDFLIPMLYDEHSAGSAPGPIASNDWFRKGLMTFESAVPGNKTVVGLADYSHDWKIGVKTAASPSFGQAARLAQEAFDGTDGVIQTDPRSGCPFFTYYDDSPTSNAHVVWMEDAVTAFNELKMAAQYHPLGAALWRLGQEDPSLWSFFGKLSVDQIGNFDPQTLANISYGYFGIETMGAGDVLSVVGTPTIGERKIVTDSAAGLISSELFTRYPSQYVVQRTGKMDQQTQLNTQKIVALTFDDGPDPRWTPQILDILHRYRVPATFFVVGENAEANPSIVSREWEDGMEIGNHSFTHPEMDLISHERIKLELDATQRVIEAITGHETLLFRAPNKADSDPSTLQDLAPVIDGDKLGYLFIGEQIDPNDWLPGITANRIVWGKNGVVTTASRGNCILLHDAGGETRAETVKALPIIIQTLKARGYRFVLVSDLTDKTKADLFPDVQGRQRWFVIWDRFAFDASYWISRVLSTVFVLTIVLGIGRIFVFTVLALLQHRREKVLASSQDYRPAVSVVIAAYNEAKVICRTIDTLLQSSYSNLEIVVVDDGSTDGTSDIVLEKFGSVARVKLIEKTNGGKATALNFGIRQCSGEIIVALDADTMFDNQTVANLVRHFDDPIVGAVSGNVKVGNRHNAWTWWQALEYITSQNFDRRAFDLLNCIGVVPGAVGAWRKDAVVLAGLYSSQTLAEDTDLTFKVRKLGYRIITDNAALAYTEAPDTLNDLAKQRFRWAYGTLQCLWKHRTATFNPKYGAFGFFALPSMWLFQIIFQALAPLVDAAILWTVFYSLVFSPQFEFASTMLLLRYWAVFTVVELSSAFVALRLDREDYRLLFWLPLQRFVYRQMMYYVILKSIVTAIKGTRVGWGKIDRRGNVSCPTQPTQAQIDKGRDLIERI